jgi:hypothetical protein
MSVPTSITMFAKSSLVKMTRRKAVSRGIKTFVDPFTSDIAIHFNTCYAYSTSSSGTSCIFGVSE